MLLTLAALVQAAQPEFHIEATSQIMPETVALDLRGRMDGEKDGYVTTVARIDPTGTWIGRAGVGFDVFGGRDGLEQIGGVGPVRLQRLVGHVETEACELAALPRDGSPPLPVSRPEPTGVPESEPESSSLTQPKNRTKTKRRVKRMPGPYPC